MTTKIIKIGNSRGIRIPKSILDQSGIKDEVELEVKEKAIIIRSISGVRQGWDMAFQKMAVHNDDIMLDHESLDNLSSWDEEEWTW